MHKSNNILLINEQFTAVYPSLVKTLDSLTLAVVLQTIHFKAQLTDDGWVHCSMQELADATGLSRDGVQRAMIKLRQKNLLFEDNQDGYNNSKSWKIDYEVLSDLASTALSQSQKLSSAKSQNSSAISHTKYRDSADSSFTKELIKNNKNTLSEIPQQAIDYSNLLADLIAKRGVKRPKVTNNWFKDMDKINRLDGYSWEHIEATIRWIDKDNFWYKVVLSPGKLREKMIDLELRMKESGGGLSGWARVIAKFENEQKELGQ